MSFRTKVIVVFGAALLLLGSLSILSYLRIRQDDQDQEWVEHTHTILEELDGFQTDLVSVGTSTRNYTTSGERTYLTEYQNALIRLAQDSSQLQALTIDNPDQRMLLVKLASLVAGRLEEYSERVDTFQRSDRTVTIPTTTATPLARETNEQIRGLLASLKSAEQKLLKLRLDKASASGKSLRIVILSGNAFALAFLILACGVVQLEMNKRKQVEETLRVSEERLRLMISGVKDYAIFSLDAEGRVATWNVGAERIKGYHADEVVNQHFARFYTNEDRNRGLPSHHLKAAADQGWAKDEGWRVRKDGSRFWASTIITALRDESGRLRGFGKLTRDMTEQKQAQQEMELRNAQLEAANKELEAFSYSVSHDLRAPLRSIDGFSLALLEDHSERLDVHAKDYLNRVRAAAQRMSLLIDDLLGLAKVSRVGMSRELIDLSALARAVAADLSDTDPTRNVQFVIAPNLYAQGDTQLLRTVFENLMNNAWKFTSKRTAARIEIGQVRIGDVQTFFVQDNGAGFDPAHAARLFGAFQRLHGSDEFPGTGIGLASVQRIIHRHGGEIWASAEVGQGATFHFTLLVGQGVKEGEYAVQR